MYSPFVLPFCFGVVFLLAVSVVKYIRWMGAFSPAQRSQVRAGLRSVRLMPAAWEMVREGLLHLRITRHHWLLGCMHRSLAFGWFLLIVAGALQALLACGGSHPFYAAIFFNYFEPRSERIGAFRQSALFANLMDLLLLYVFAGLLLAVCKRLWSKSVGIRRTPRHNISDRVAKGSLWCIFPLRLLAEASTAARFGNGGFLVRAAARPIAALGWNAPFFEYQSWMLYSLSLGCFFCFLPFTRYMHIFTELLLIFFRRLGLREEEQPTGYTRFELSACSRCGICIDGCPVSRQLDHQGSQGVYLLQALRNKDIWGRAERMAEACVVCGRCSAECPVGLDLETLRRQVRAAGRAAIDKAGGFAMLDGVKPFNAVGRVAYFGGCMSHLTPATTEAMKRIFKAVGQPYWHMDERQGICCGRPLQQQGLERQAAELRRRNTELIEQSHAAFLVTSCPICCQSFRKEYHLSVPVLHHTEYLARLLAGGRLHLRPDGTRATYHDPCELGRGCGVYEAPRQVLSAALQLLPTRQEREHSLCCGYSLGSTAFSNEELARIRDASLQNLLAPQPDLVATACPMCKKAFTRGQELPVKDVAEIVAERLAVRG